MAGGSQKCELSGSRVFSSRICVPHVEEDAGANEHAEKSNHEKVTHGVRVVIWECDHNVAEILRSLVLSSICSPEQASDSRLCGAKAWLALGDASDSTVLRLRSSASTLLRQLLHSPEAAASR